jgi:hypothetical protein
MARRNAATLSLEDRKNMGVLLQGG